MSRVTLYVRQLAGESARAASCTAPSMHLPAYSQREYTSESDADEEVLRRGVPPVDLTWVEMEAFQKFYFGQDSWLEIVRPDELPFDWSESPKLELQQALLWMLTFQDNFGHLVGEHGPTMHALVCAYLGRYVRVWLAVILTMRHECSMAFRALCTLKAMPCQLPLLRIPNAWLLQYCRCQHGRGVRHH